MVRWGRLKGRPEGQTRRVDRADWKGRWGGLDGRTGWTRGVDLSCGLRRRGSNKGLIGMLGVDWRGRQEYRSDCVGRLLSELRKWKKRKHHPYPRLSKRDEESFIMYYK